MFSGAVFPSVPLNIENQFYGRGGAQFVEDANQIIPYRVFGQVELPRDLLIAHSVGHDAQEAALALTAPFLQ